MNARQRRETAGFLAAGGSVESYTLAARLLRPVWARLRGRPVPVLRPSRTATGPVPDPMWAAAPFPPLDAHRPASEWSR